MTEDFYFNEHSHPCDWLVIAWFFVEGVPAGQPRVKFARRGNFVQAYTPDGGAPGAWKEMLFWQAKKYVPKDWEKTKQPVRVDIKAFFKRTKEFDRDIYPDSPFEYANKPDDDNIRKMVLDVFTSLGFWDDDKQVCGGSTEKYYVGRGSYEGTGKTPGALICISVAPNWPYKKAKGKGNQ